MATCDADSLYDSGVVGGWVYGANNALMGYAESIRDLDVTLTDLSSTFIQPVKYTFKHIPAAETPAAYIPSGFTVPTAIFTPIDTNVSIDITINDPGDPPEYNPTITTNVRTPPDPFDETRPTAPTLVTLTQTTSPGYELLPLPDVQDLRVPTIAELGLTSWSETAPVGPANTTPEPFSYTGSDYTATAELVSHISSWLDGDTSMPDSAWRSMLNSVLRKPRRETQMQSKQAVRAFAELGWEDVGGTLDNALRTLQENVLDVELDAFNKTFDDHTKQEYENLQMAFKGGVQLEGQLASAWHSERMRELQAQEALIDITEKTLNMQLMLIDSYLMIYLTEAEIYATKITQDIGELQREQEQIRAQGLITQENEAYIKRHNARVEAATLGVQEFIAAMGQVKTIARNNRTIAKLYQSETEGYKGEIDAWAVQWKGFIDQILGQMPKAQRHSILSTIFAERVRAWQAGVQLKGLETEAEVAERTVQVQKIRALLREFSAKARLASQQLQAQRQVSERQWQTLSGYYSAIGSTIGASEVTERMKIAQELATRAEELQQYVQDVEDVLVQRRKDLAQDEMDLEIQANMRAALLNVVNVGASLSESTSFSKGKSCNTSFEGN